MENQTELSEIELSQESNANTQDTQETLNSEPEITEPKPIPNPWDNAPENVYFYEKIYKDGHLGSFTQSAESAYKSGWDIENNYIPISDTQQSDINGWTYLKDKCPESTIEELKARKLAEISAEAHKYSQYECEDMYLTSSVGYKINADHKSQDNIRGLIGLGVQCRFKDYNNEYHPGTTIEQLQTMLTECYANGAMLYQQKFNYEDMVANAKSREELYFDVVFDMADFSKS